RLIRDFWSHYKRRSVSVEVRAELDHIEGRLRRFTQPRTAAARLRSAISGFRQLKEPVEAAKACLALMTLHFFAGSPDEARVLKKTLEELSRDPETPLADRAAIEAFCELLAAGAATQEEAEATLASLNAWRPE